MWMAKVDGWEIGKIIRELPEIIDVDDFRFEKEKSVYLTKGDAWDIGKKYMYLTKDGHFRTVLRLPNRYNNVQSMEELKIRLDMEGNHVRS